MVARVSAVVLPERVRRTFWIDGDRLRLDPVADADTVVDGGWVLPGLVDTHTHPGTKSPSDPFDADLFRSQLRDHRDAGVLLVRTPGTAARIPTSIYDQRDLPRVTSAGRWLATPGRFIPGYGRDITEDELVAAAVEEARAASGWCKVIADWLPDEPAVPVELLTEMVNAVHAIGGRVAAHCQTADGCRNAVAAGVDSLEHGMHLDHSLLPQMAAQGTALIPTLTTFGESAEKVGAREPSPRKDWWMTGWERMFSTVRTAHEAGVTILAGTDNVQFGSVAGEVDWLIQAGLPAEIAVGAASWTARGWLGLAGLVDGAPADMVAYDRDPPQDPTILTRPKRIILRGGIVL